ncbi:unnamed protein product, partial [Musa acuminata subsp. burmannicoides]
MRAVDLLGLGCLVAAGHGSAGDVGGRGAGLRLGVEREVADGGDDQETADGHGGGPVRQLPPLLQHLGGSHRRRRSRRRGPFPILSPLLLIDSFTLLICSLAR